MENVVDKPIPGLDLYWRIAIRRRWWLLTTFVVVWALVLSASYIIPPKYRSEALILVQQQQVPQQYVVPNVTMDIAARMNALTEQILSRTKLLAIATKFNLYSAAGDPDQIADAMRNDISIDLQTATATTSASHHPEDLTAFKLSYVNKNPQMAQQVTNELTSLFIDTSARHSAEASQQTTEFLQHQLELARRDLDEQETKLKAFKTQYLGELPEQLQSNLQILSGLQGRLQTATTRLNNAEQQRVYLESMLSQYKSAASQVATANVPVTPATIDENLAKLHQELTDLQAKYTDKHPDVIHVKGEIAAAEALKARMEKEIAAQKDSPSAALTPSQAQAQAPMIQVQSQLKSTELEIANDKAEIKNINAEVAQYQSRLNLTPMREQQLTGILRDHDQSQKNYDELLKKSQQSELASSLETRQQGEQFKLIDPPSMPLAPYFPNRVKMALAGIGLGLALGIVVAGAVEFLNLRVFTDTQVKNIVGSSVMIIGIPSLWTASEMHRKKRSLWMQSAVASILVIVVFAVTAMTVLGG